jgi:hypothetical protein
LIVHIVRVGYGFHDKDGVFGKVGLEKEPDIVAVEAIVRRGTYTVRNCATAGIMFFTQRYPAVVELVILKRTDDWRR